MDQPGVPILTSIMMPLMNFVGNLGYVYLYFRRLPSSPITVGDVQAFMHYVRQFNQP